jgi:hypothetical protein
LAVVEGTQLVWDHWTVRGRTLRVGSKDYLLSGGGCAVCVQIIINNIYTINLLR